MYEVKTSTKFLFYRHPSKCVDFNVYKYVNDAIIDTNNQEMDLLQNHQQHQEHNVELCG